MGQNRAVDPTRKWLRRKINSLRAAALDFIVSAAEV